MSPPPQFVRHEAIPGEPGWFSWELRDNERFNGQVMGPLKARAEGDACRLRMRPVYMHSNLLDNVHGGATLSLIDIALFVTMHMLGEGDAGPAVTLELSTQFIGGGKINEDMDAVTQIMRETRNLVFLRGEVVQGDHIVAAYSGIIRKSPKK